MIVERGKIVDPGQKGVLALNERIEDKVKTEEKKIFLSLETNISNKKKNKKKEKGRKRVLRHKIRLTLIGQKPPLEMNYPHF